MARTVVDPAMMAEAHFLPKNSTTRTQQLPGNCCRCFGECWLSVRKESRQTDDSPEGPETSEWPETSERTYAKKEIIDFIKILFILLYNQYFFQTLNF